MISLSCFACKNRLHCVVKVPSIVIVATFIQFIRPTSSTGVVSKSGGSSCGLTGSTRIIYEEELDCLTFFEIQD